MSTILSADSEISRIFSQYKDGLDAVKTQHQNGDNSKDIIRGITEITDTLVILILNEHLKQILGTDETPPHILMLAQGGYGRRELHPKSDIDLIFLYQNTLSSQEQEVVKSVFRTLFDLGFHVGHCCRSFKDAFETAVKDDQSRTAMSECRFLAGDWRLFEKFISDFWKIVSKNKKDFIRAKIENRLDRNARQGTTINISEPNVKESAGGLRDYHFGLWIGSLAQGHTLNLQHLKYHHLIDDQMMNAVERAIGFLWRLRNDMHFLTGKEQDVLAMLFQKEISQRLGYLDQKGRLSEEHMMRDYYKHALTLLEFADHMQRQCTPRPFWDYFKLKNKKALNDGFYLYDKEIHIPPDFHFFEHHPPRLIQAFILSAQYDAPLSKAAYTAIRDNLHLVDKAFIHHKDTAKLLREFFSLPCKIEPALQTMRKIGILEYLFPEWREIANLVRYDLVHRFTVDEHSILCLYYLDAIGEDSFQHSGDRAVLWKNLRRKDILRLSILFHDIGKGRNEDHSVLGSKLIDDIVKRLRYNEEDRTQMVFLVRNHLLMSHTAQHRDLADPQVTTDFVDKFDSTEQINLMYLLTYTDLRSVSPEAMTEWKNNLLWQLYTSSLELLAGDTVSTEEQNRAISHKELIKKEISDEFDPLFIQDHLDRLPHSYLIYQTTKNIRQHLEMIRKFDGHTPVTFFFPHVDPACRDMVLVTSDKVGLFNQICTAVMLENFNIEEARLNTRSDGIVANNIVIRDALGKSDITESRQSLLKDRIAKILTSDAPPPKVPQSIGKPAIGRSSFANHVRIYNDSSARFTVVVVRCADRRGLLQDLTSVFSEMNVNIHFARIITEGNRVTDVFYVAESSRGKIENQEMLNMLHNNLKEVISFENYDG